MPYPSAPEILTSYTAQEQALGDGTFPGQEIDVDLAAVRASITAVIEFLKVFTRSDGRLANGSVTSDTLASSLIIGFDPPAPWGTGTAYTTRSTVFQGFGFYLCTAEHTSGVFATDLASGRWVLLADLTPPGGSLIAANNLSDLADVANARTNLGLGSMATAASGTGASQHRTNLQNEAFFQPLASTLTSWAALSRAAGFDTFAVTPSSANLRALLSDESGSGALLFAGGDLGTPSAVNLANASGLTTSGVASSTLVTSGEEIWANNDDNTWPTSATVVDAVGAYLIVADEKTSGTAAGGSLTSWSTRTLNTVRTNTISGASLSSNRITLPAGTYRIMASAPAYRSDTIKTRLRNITDSTTTLEGTSEYTEVGGAAVQTRSFINGVFTIAGTKAFEIQMIVGTAIVTNGWGVATSLGTEVYAIAEIQRIA